MKTSDWISLISALFTAVAGVCSLFSVFAAYRTIRYSMRPVLLLVPQNFSLEFIHNPVFEVSNHGNSPAIVDRIEANGFVLNEIKRGARGFILFRSQPEYWHPETVEVPVEEPIIPTGGTKRYELGKKFQAFFGQKDGVAFTVTYHDFKGNEYKQSCTWKNNRWTQVGK